MYTVVLQKSTPTQIRQLVLYTSKNTSCGMNVYRNALRKPFLRNKVDTGEYCGDELENVHRAASLERLAFRLEKLEHPAMVQDLGDPRTRWCYIHKP